MIKVVLFFHLLSSFCLETGVRNGARTGAVDRSDWKEGDQVGVGFGHSSAKWVLLMDGLPARR